MLPKTLKGFTAFLDGYGFLGRVSGGTAPKLSIKVEEYRDGGMDIPYDIDMGMEKLELDVSFMEYDPIIYGRFGLIGQNVPLTLRGSLEGEDGTTTSIVHSARGLVKELDGGSWESAKPGSLKLSMAPRFYQLTIGGSEIIYIDIQNGVRRINGVDQLATRRQNLGL